MQDAVAISVAVVAAAWLIRSLAARCLGSPCQPPAAAAPAGSDGFVPLESLARGRPAQEGVRRRDS